MYICIAHVLTWYVEECGNDIVNTMPALVDLQCNIIESEYMKEFIRGPNYYPLGNKIFCEQVEKILDRKIL